MLGVLKALRVLGVLGVLGVPLDRRRGEHRLADFGCALPNRCKCSALACRQPRVPRRRCGGGEPSPGADVAGVSPVPVQMWQG